jgi:hypothetical protein
MRRERSDRRASRIWQPSEHELNTFEGWLRYQGVDAGSPPEYLAQWRSMYDDAIRNRPPAVGLMKLRSVPGEYRYGVAVRGGPDLWLALWVRRSVDQLFAMLPRGDLKANVHASYHRDGTVHMKSDGRKGTVRKLQPLDSEFRNTEHLCAFHGYGPKKVGAVCDPSAFNGLIELPPTVLGPRHGMIVVDLVEPGCKPISWPGATVKQETFKDAVPWTAIRVISQ